MIKKTRQELLKALYILGCKKKCVLLWIISVVVINNIPGENGL